MKTEKQIVFQEEVNDLEQGILRLIGYSNNQLELCFETVSDKSMTITLTKPVNIGFKEFVDGDEFEEILEKLLLELRIKFQNLN